MPDPSRQTVLVVRAGARLCGLPIASVIETLRPLPVAPLAGAPPFVRGVSVVRGEPVPVVDLDALLGGSPDAPAHAPARFVTIRAGGRVSALAVDGVVGVTELDERDARQMPLVSDACAGALASVRARDGDLLLVLGAARLVPEDVHRAIARREAGA